MCGGEYTLILSQSKYTSSQLSLDLSIAAGNVAENENEIEQSTCVYTIPYSLMGNAIPSNLSRLMKLDRVYAIPLYENGMTIHSHISNTTGDYNRIQQH